MDETKWDKLLRIKTSGRDDSNADTYRYPYEPTSYFVLERLANSGLVRKSDTVVDFGCGKGRVDFFLSYQIGCKTIGVEYDERIYGMAEENRETAAKASKVSFVNCRAEEFEIPDETTAFYFFNPFSVELLRSVMERIKETYYRNPRELQLLFYYPSDEYISYLMTVEELQFADEIDCRDLFDSNDERERVVIFEFV